MTTKHLVFLLIAGTAATAVAAHARRSISVEPAGRSTQVTGVVTAPAADGRVMVAHDDIPGYMPAMTMPFAVDAGEGTSLKTGDRVRFTLSVSAERSKAHDFEVIGHDARVAAAPRGGTRAGGRLRKGDPLPEFSLTTADGKTLTSADLRDRVTAITFVFTRCPMPEFCPLMVKRFQQLQRDLANEPPDRVRLLSVTLDPEFDTPPVLRAYAEAMGAEPARWQFATGATTEIARLASAFSIHIERSGVLIDHTLATAVVDADGRIVEIWRGNGWSAREVLDAVRRAAAGGVQGAGFAGSVQSSSVEVHPQTLNDEP